jgi:hypothetical protein
MPCEERQDPLPLFVDMRRTFPVLETFGSRQYFGEFPPDRRRMGHVVARQYERWHSATVNALDSRCDND